MKTTLKIDRECFAVVLRELIDDDTRCMEPCLVYDTETGEFAIESKLSPRGESEHVVADRIGDTWLESDAAETRSKLAAAVESLREKMAAEAVVEAMTGMDDDYIAEYVIGNLDTVDD